MNRATKTKAIEWLNQHLKPGTIIYSNVIHWAKNSQTRWAKFYIVIDNKIENITYWIACALDLRLEDKQGGQRAIRTTSNPENTINNLSYLLHGYHGDPNGLAVKQGLHAGFTFTYMEL